MGLEDFKSDDSTDETATESDVENDEVVPVFETEDEHEGSNDLSQLSGLDSFRTSKTKSDENDSPDELDRERANPWMEDFTANQWNDMTTKEKVKYVRENYYPSYRPEISLDSEWSCRMVIEVDCECENTFTFRSGGTCMDCGRGYKYTGERVVKKHDPHMEIDNE